MHLNGQAICTVEAASVGSLVLGCSDSRFDNHKVNNGTLGLIHDITEGRSSSWVGDD
jgi:hypothetical protein